MDTASLAKQILAGNRRALARGLTLVESLRPEHQTQSLQLFSGLGPGSPGFRLGVTGPPGAGKSTLIERVVLRWVREGHKVAILAVDPSSRRTGGSLLGDKTRMGEIADLPEVFIRPAPAGEQLGGLSRRTPLMCALLERAGYGRVVVETVGVGQSEISATYLVDKLLLVALPGAGDEVQGLKRGLMEEVDLVAVNKADLGLSQATVAVLKSALRVFRREVPVLSVSATEETGIDQLLEHLESDPLETSERRVQGDLHFFDQFVRDEVERILRSAASPWNEARERVALGQLDLLGALPLMEDVLARFREAWSR